MSLRGATKERRSNPALDCFVEVAPLRFATSPRNDIYKENGRVISFVFILFALIFHSTSFVLAQNMPHEAGFWFASGGQIPLLTPNNVNRGYYTNPTIEHAYYSFRTNGVQSLSVFIEHVDETRPWNGVWTNLMLGDGSANFPASVQENLHMTTIGLETIRTFISESGFRLGAGLGLGYGLGGASAVVHNISTDQTTTYNSATAWSGLMLEGFLRARYSLIVTGRYDIGIMAMGRFWGFPAIGPLDGSGSDYNGPALRVLSEFGYLAGIAIGF
jgi:hypothetical protein